MCPWTSLNSEDEADDEAEPGCGEVPSPGVGVGSVGHFRAVTAAIFVWRICEIKKLLASFWAPPPSSQSSSLASNPPQPSVPGRSHQVICWSLAKCSW